MKGINWRRIITIVIVVLVLIGAYIFSTKPQGPIYTEPLPLVTQAPDSETANWKTYTYRKEITFKYPEDWEIQPTGGGCGITINPPGTKDIQLTVCGTYVNDSVQGIVSRYLKSSSPRLNQEEFVIDDHKGIRLDFHHELNKSTELHAFIGDIATMESDGKTPQRYTGTLHVYLTIRDSVVKSRMDEGKNIFDQILSTFKFSDQTSISN